MASTKRKRVVLQLRDKLDILDRIEKGEQLSKLAAEYHVGMSTIYDIRKNAPSISRYVSTLEHCAGSMRKTMKRANDEQVDEAVLRWFRQKRLLGESVSGPQLCEKALEVSVQLKGPSEFKASSGWLKNFKSRHGISHSDMQGLPASLLNPASSETLQRRVLALVKEDSYRERNLARVLDRIKRQKQACPTHGQALAAFEKGLKWLEQQAECDPGRLLALRGLRDLAAKKKMDGAKEGNN